MKYLRLLYLERNSSCLALMAPRLFFLIRSTASSYFIPSSISAVATSTGALHKLRSNCFFWFNLDILFNWHHVHNMLEVWKLYLTCFPRLPAKSSDAVDSDACFRISLELSVDQREPPLNDFLGGRRPIREGELRHSHTWVQLGQHCLTISVECVCVNWSLGELNKNVAAQCIMMARINWKVWWWRGSLSIQVLLFCSLFMIS